MTNNIRDLIRIKPETAVVIGVVIASFSAIFVRINDAPPLVIAFYRLLFSQPFFIIMMLNNRKELLALLSQEGIINSRVKLFTETCWRFWEQSSSHCIF